MRPSAQSRATSWQKLANCNPVQIESESANRRGSWQRPRYSTSRPTGSVTVKAVPWAKVYEGERLLGTTPMAQVPLAEGTHVLTFINPELPPIKRTVVVRQGEETKIAVELKR